MGTAIPGTFNSSLEGLLGNFDGISTNDFILPNGTVLENRNYTEKEIYYKFGQHCKYCDVFSLDLTEDFLRTQLL